MKFLRAGTAFGGPCFPRDTRALLRIAEMAGGHFPLASLIKELNEQKSYALWEAVYRAAQFHNAISIGILGLSYKPNTLVIEESAGISLAQRLIPVFQIIVFDPLAMSAARAVLGESVTYAKSMMECIQTAELVVLMHDDVLLGCFNFQEKIVIDPWRIMHPYNYRHCKAYVPLGIGQFEKAVAIP
jgi:UDPglucose 6-dehydrogenase